MTEQTRSAIETLLDKGKEILINKTLFDNCTELIAGELLNKKDYIERCLLFREIIQAVECDKLVQYELRKELKLRHTGLFKKEIAEHPVFFERDEDFRPFKPELCLPSGVAEYFNEVVSNVQVFPEMAALSCLSVLASTVQGKARISANGDYAEKLCIYTLTVGSVSERKSSTFDVFLEPVKVYRLEENKRRKPQIRKAHAELKALKHEIRSFEQHKSNSGTIENYKENCIKAEEFEENMIREIPAPVTSATPEAFVEEMVRNNGKVTVLSSECGIFDVIGGMYSKSGKTDLDPMLNAWSGSAMSISRAGGRKMQIEHPTATIGLMAQPEKFNEIVSTKGFSERGLTARFLYAFAKAKAGDTTFRSPKISDDARLKFSEIINRMLRLPEPDEDKEAPVIYFNDKAQKIAEEYYDKIERARKDGIFSEGTFAQGYGGKVFGNYVRIAGVLHLCEHGLDEAINEKTALMAQRFSEWTINQAKKIINDTATESEEERRIMALVKKLKKKYEQGAMFTKKDITDNYKNLKVYKCERGLLSDDVSEMITRFFLVDASPETLERKSVRFTLNPLLYELT